MKRWMGLLLTVALLVGCKAPQLSRNTKGVAEKDFALAGTAIGDGYTLLQKEWGEPAGKAQLPGKTAYGLTYATQGMMVYADLAASDKLLGWETLPQSPYATGRGIKLGSTREQVVAAYGDKLLPESGERFLWYAHPKKADVKLAFELHQGKVIRIGAGTAVVTERWVHVPEPASALLPAADLQVTFGVRDYGAAKDDVVVEEIIRDGARFVATYNGSPYVTWVLNDTGLWRVDPRGGGALLRYLPPELEDGAAWKQVSGTAEVWFRLTRATGPCAGQGADAKCWTVTVLNRGEETAFTFAPGLGPVSVMSVDHVKQANSFTKTIRGQKPGALKEPDKSTALKNARPSQGALAPVVQVTAEEFEAATEKNKLVK